MIYGAKLLSYHYGGHYYNETQVSDNRWKETKVVQSLWMILFLFRPNILLCCVPQHGPDAFYSIPPVPVLDQTALLSQILFDHIYLINIWKASFLKRGCRCLSWSKEVNYPRLLFVGKTTGFSQCVWFAETLPVCSAAPCCINLMNCYLLLSTRFASRANSRWTWTAFRSD